MHARSKRWTLLAVLAVVLLVAFLGLRGRLSGRPVAPERAVAMTLIGYTNMPGNPLRFGLFSVSNQAPYGIRWRGSWVEVEGSPHHKAETVNPSLPGFTRKPVLKAGEAFKIAIGEPFDDSENIRWRFAMSYTPYTWREQWLDFSMRHRLPPRLGTLVLGDTQGMLSPTNNVTVTTAWLSVTNN